jgi:hypothetical protein
MRAGQVKEQISRGDRIDRSGATRGLGDGIHVRPDYQVGRSVRVSHNARNSKHRHESAEVGDDHTLPGSHIDANRRERAVE